MHVTYYLLRYRKIFFTLFIIIISISFIINCSYQLHTTDCLHEKLKKYHNITHIILYSYDPFSPITRTIYLELCRNNIDVIDNLKNYINIKDTYMYLHIIKVSESHIPNSVFADGTEAEYQLVIHMYAKITMPNKNYYPINIQVHRAFIRNSINALYNDTQENDIRVLMYQEIAEKLIFHIRLQCNNVSK